MLTHVQAATSGLGTNTITVVGNEYQAAPPTDGVAVSCVDNPRDDTECHTIRASAGPSKDGYTLVHPPPVSESAPVRIDCRSRNLLRYHRM